MIKRTLKFKMSYLLGTLLTDMLREHKRLAVKPNPELVEVFDQQRIDLAGSEGFDHLVLMIHRRQLPVFTIFLDDVNDFLANSIFLNRKDLQTPEGLQLIRRLLELQELRSKTDFAVDFPEMEVD